MKVFQNLQTKTKQILNFCLGQKLKSVKKFLQIIKKSYFAKKLKKLKKIDTI